VLVKDIKPGGEGSLPASLTVVNGILFFSADDGVNGRELWRSDGTAAGTYMVKIASEFGSNPENLINFNGTLLLTAIRGPGLDNDRERWRSDGTAAGTYLVKDIFPGTSSDPMNPGGSSNPSNLTVVGSTLFFTAASRDTVASPNRGVELWKTD